MSTETKTTVINGVTYTDTIIDGVLASSSWTDANGTGTIARTTDAGSGDVTELTTWTNSGDAVPITSSEYVYDSAGNFKGGTKTENGVTFTYDDSRTVISKTFNLLLISNSNYTETFGNAPKVAELYGLEESEIQFQITNNWQDQEDSNNKWTEVSFFNTDGTKIGVMNVNSGSWMDGDNKILSTNTSFDTVDDEGNSTGLGRSWTNYDSQNTSDTSDDELRDSGSNSRVTKEISAVTLPTGITVADTVSEIVVETGTNRWVDPQGKESTSDFTRYFVETS